MFAHRMETNIFDIATGVLQGNALAPYIHNLLRKSTSSVDRPNKRT